MRSTCVVHVCAASMVGTKVEEVPTASLVPAQNFSHSIYPLAIVEPAMLHGVLSPNVQ